MGTSGNFSTSNSYVKYTISITQNSQNVSENCSNVTVKVRFFRTNSGYTTYGSGTVYCKINGTTYSASVSTSQKITNSGIDLFSKTLDIYHDSDGSKTLSTSAWISLDTPLSSSEQSYSQTLTTIPRASQPSLSATSVTMGNSVTVYTNRASSSFTHELYWQIGNGNWNWIAGSIGANYTWNVPTNLANNTPNSTRLSLNMILETYSGNACIGVKSVTLRALVPSAFTPTINSVSFTENTSGIASKFGCFVQGKSTIHGVISASGTHSSTIKNYKINLNSQYFNTSNFTTNPLTGLEAYTVTVTDTRNRTASTSGSVSVTGYFSPTIYNFSVVRCDQNGTTNDVGAYAKCTIVGDIASVNNKNDKAFQIFYRKLTDTNYVTINLSSSSYYYSGTQIIPADVNSEYEFIFKGSDYFGSTQKSENLSTAFTLMDFNANGKSIAFGRVSTATGSQSKAQIKMDVEIEGNFKLNETALTYDVSGQKLIYSQHGLYSPHESGTYLDLYGNFVTKQNMDVGCWRVSNNGTDYFHIEWGDKKTSGAIGAIYQAKSLYNNSSGTAGTVTLADYAYNYSVFDIMFKTNDGDFDTTRVYSPDGKTVLLQGSYNTGSDAYSKLARVHINNATMTYYFIGECHLNSGSVSTGNTIYIIKVTAYK